ncbi:MAG TPA: sigma 54-interacting transcriptional regulator, partial [Burkholderiales bacterium]|nr:sigma 54-interacting transcriptional regulator [Burkholderiales bacterium]
MTAPKATILAVDDDPALLKLLSMMLTMEGYKVLEAESGEKALALLATSTPQLVITDLKMGGIDGLTLFENIHRSRPTLPVIILTAHGTIPDAVGATRRGVFGYLTKPFEAASLLAEVEKALRLSGADIVAPTQADWRSEIITRSLALEAILSEALLVARGDAAVLIQGETGTGKELLARAIHKASPRRERPFVAINCSAIPEQLLESELFGHMKGSFTGAARDHKGLFQAAQGGTLFLDEIGDMPPALQVKLLRVLQEKEVRPIGATQSLPVDVRIISATHRELERDITAGRFREDLYYRLNVVSFTLPPLSERREDIPLLATHFLSILAKRYKRQVNGFVPEALELLVKSSWPGNVRQLANVVEKIVALATTAI